MKKNTPAVHTRLWAALVLLLAFTISMPAQAQLAIGTKAPEINLRDNLGNYQKLSSLRGYWTILHFWSSQSPASRTTAPNLTHIYNRFQNTLFKEGMRGIKIMTVSLDENSQEWTTALKIDNLPGTHHVQDFYTTAANQYQVTGFPFTYLIDPEGNIRLANADFQTMDFLISQNIGVVNQTNTEPSYFTTQASTQQVASVRGNAAVLTRSVDNLPVNYFTTNTNTAAPAAPQGTSYKIQVGAYRKVNMVEFNTLTAFGNPTPEQATGSDITRVMIGNFDNLTTAINALHSVQANPRFADAFLVEYKNNARVRILSKAEVQAAATTAPQAQAQPTTASAATNPYIATGTQDVAVVRSPVVTSQNTSGNNTLPDKISFVTTPVAPPPAVSSGNNPYATVTYDADRNTNQNQSQSQGQSADKNVRSPSVNVANTNTQPPKTTTQTPPQQQNNTGSTTTKPAAGTQSDTRFSNSTTSNNTAAPQNQSTLPANNPSRPNTQPQQQVAQPQQTTTQQQPKTTPATQPAQQQPQTAPVSQPAQTTQPANTAKPLDQNQLDKQIDSYLQNYDYSQLEGTKSKRLKNKNKRDKRK